MPISFEACIVRGDSGLIWRVLFPITTVLTKKLVKLKN